MVRSKGNNASGVRPVCRLAVAMRAGFRGNGCSFASKIVLGLILACVGLAEPANANLFSVGQASGFADNTLLGNPPLPMLYHHKGDYKVTFQPYYFPTGKKDLTFAGAGGVGTVQETGSFDGWGAAGAISYGLSDKWGAHVFFMGNSLSGSFRGTISTGGNLTQKNATISSATSFTAVPMLTYQFFGSEDGRFTWPVFFGPTFRYRTLSGSARETFNGAVATDFDYETSKFDVGAMVGTEMGIPLGEKLMLNPFVIFGIPSLATDNAVGLKATTIRTNTRPAGYTGFTQLDELSQVRGSDVFFNFGANMIYRPWGLSFNLTSTFVPKIAGKISQDYDGFSMTMFTVSYSFGSYVK